MAKTIAEIEADVRARAPSVREARERQKRALAALPFHPLSDEGVRRAVIAYDEARCRKFGTDRHMSDGMREVFVPLMRAAIAAALGESPELTGAELADALGPPESAAADCNSEEARP